MLSSVRVASAQRAGTPLSAEVAASYHEEIRAKYERESSAVFATARLWDDGIIEPEQTRGVLALSLEMASNAPIAETQHGIFRM